MVAHPDSRKQEVRKELTAGWKKGVEGEFGGEVGGGGGIEGCPLSPQCPQVFFISKDKARHKDKGGLSDRRISTVTQMSLTLQMQQMWPKSSQVLYSKRFI